MRATPVLLGAALLLATASCRHLESHEPSPASTSASQGAALAPERLFIIDGHIDVPDRLHEKLGPTGEPTEDISQRTAGGDFDYPRAKQGGLGVPFMSIYVPAELQDKAGASKARADALIDMMEKIARASPDKFALAPSVDQALAAVHAGKVAFAMGIENGSALEDSLRNVAHFHARGVRYITLAHGKDNLLSDSSYTEGPRRWKGLSPFGKQVVAEMNRVGIMVDVSHLSDDAIRQAVETSRLPVIASHSSCRHFTPGFERNLSDELIRAVSARGGVVMINFGSSFLIPAANAQQLELNRVLQAFIQAHGVTRESPEVKAFVETWQREHPTPHARVEDVADHVEHVVKLVGIEHVGLGSDFDGVGPTLPTGLEDVSQYPHLLRVLRERGWGEADLEKLTSGNLLRVWRQVEAYAARAGAAPPTPAP